MLQMSASSKHARFKSTTHTLCSTLHAALHCLQAAASLLKAIQIDIIL
jgi:hypothetical protein